MRNYFVVFQKVLFTRILRKVDEDRKVDTVEKNQVSLFKDQFSILKLHNY